MTSNWNHILIRAIIGAGCALGSACSSEVRSATPATGRHADGRIAARRRIHRDTATVRLPLELPAQLYVEHDAVVVARSAGTIDALHAELGDRVSAGQLLARLESTDQAIALAGADAAYESMTRTAARTRLLKKGGGATAADSEQVEFQLRQADVQRRKAQRDVELTRVTAPFAGIVTARLARPRRFVEVGDTLFRVTESSPLFARVRVPEAGARQLRVGDSATIAAGTGFDYRRESRPRGAVRGSGKRHARGGAGGHSSRRRAARRKQRDGPARPRAATRRHRAA